MVVVYVCSICVLIVQERCVEMYASSYGAGQWNDKQCGALRNFVCQQHRRKPHNARRQISAFCNFFPEELLADHDPHLILI